MEKYVDNVVFKFDICLKQEFEPQREIVYVKPFLYSETDEEECSKEKFVQRKYFTQDKINELKNKFIERIIASDNPFSIYCTDIDGGYLVTEEQIFKL